MMIDFLQWDQDGGGGDREGEQDEVRTGGGDRDQ